MGVPVERPIKIPHIIIVTRPFDGRISCVGLAEVTSTRALTESADAAQILRFGTKGDFVNAHHDMRIT